MARSRKTEADPAGAVPPPDGEPVAVAAEAPAAEPSPSDETPAHEETPAGPGRPTDPAPISPPPRPRRTFLPLFLGGAVAAVAGSAATVYVATTYPEVPRVLGLGQPTDAGLEDRLAEQGRQIADLSAKLAAPPPPGGAGQETLDALRAEEGKALADLSARIDQLDAKIAALGQDLARARTAAPAGATAADIAAATEEATRQAQAAAEEAARVRAETEAIARASAISAALSELDADIENGTPLDGALATLTEAGVTVPEALLSQAQGVPTLAHLRQSFPAAARDALAMSLAETAGEGTTWDRLSAFLRSQTQARSLSPRAGDDPDAILSRAEAALSAGDLAAALREVEALPPTGRDRMAEWAGLAQRRLAAREALAVLSNEMR